MTTIKERRNTTFNQLAPPKEAVRSGLPRHATALPEDLPVTLMEEAGTLVGSPQKRGVFFCSSVPAFKGSLTQVGCSSVRLTYRMGIRVHLLHYSGIGHNLQERSSC